MEIALEQNIKLLDEKLSHNKQLRETTTAAIQMEDENAKLHRAAIDFFDIREAEIKMNDAAGALAVAQQEAATKLAASKTAKAAVQYAELRKHEAEESALTEALNAELQKNKPVLDQLQSVAPLTELG